MKNLRLHLAVALLLASGCLAQECLNPKPCSLPQRDWKRAIWRVPLHMVFLQFPMAPVTLVDPWLGRKYVHWRQRSEQADETMQRDTAMKATVDLYSQTAIEDAILKMYGMKP